MDLASGLPLESESGGKLSSVEAGGASAGPFDDRFLLENLAFDGASVSGAVRVTSDVSAVLDLEVVAGFYDDKGALLGTGRFVHHLVDDGSHSGAPEELVTFTIAVPVLVNE